MRFFFTLAFCVIASSLIAQETFLSNDTPDKRPTSYAFTNATIMVDATTKLENATLLIESGKVVATGAEVSIPAGTTTFDMEGKFIYPGIVDPYTNYGLPAVKSQRRRSGETPQYVSEVGTANSWNEHNQAHYNAISEFKLDSKAAAEMRKNGVGAVMSYRPDGVLRGTSVLSLLADDPVNEVIINDKAAAHYAFRRGSSKQIYPNSIMGMVALIRQTFYDGAWYAAQADPAFNQTLDNFNASRNLPQVIEANSNKLRALVADNLGDEFGVQFIIKGNGDEYQRLDEIARTGASFILPVNFPAAYDVEDPYKAIDVTLAQMKHWEMAPANAAMLSKGGVQFAFTHAGLKKSSEFWGAVKKAVKHGLSKEDAWKAMTSNPAKMLKAEGQLGSLKNGRFANLIIADGDLLEDGDILETWVKGDQFVIKVKETVGLAGTYDLRVGATAYEMEVSEKENKLSAKIEVNDSTSITVRINVTGERVNLSFVPNGADNKTRLTGWRVTATDWKGTGVDGSGEGVNWTATRTKAQESRSRKDKAMDAPEFGEMIYPFVAHGWIEKPTQETILFKGATVWTLEGEGKFDNYDVLVEEGKIKQVGQDLSAPGARVVDATGRHLTPGIIDEHSHAALSGVNESSQSVVAEVRMNDAIDSEDIDIYRQLAGGVTAAQLLHGSANPVGGQSAVVKFRWGLSPEEMKIKGADGYIKFALGENVKQSNRSSDWVNRFPQTRMGVEQVFEDAFTRAVEYGREWDTYNSLPRKSKAAATAPRRDLQMETLLEIVNKQRFISCHSYVQSEINMLMKVAERYDFNINTFTHILEGYKVADIMATHGAGGSTFADWWAYKYEVKEAIPYNAVLMSQAGVVSAINSDNAEMARRLNQEAAKSIKYGSMDEIEALKMVTLNPAKLMHLDKRMGSIEVGKDADLVLWNDHPLSIYARSEITMVDGSIYYSMEQDNARRKAIADERTRLINKMLKVKNKGGKTQPVRKRERRAWHCEDDVNDLQLLKEAHSHE
ncbi:MAG: amidohydrolase family protein [Cytophagales bacterium]|nr:amidohydrolase family protein [Cytophagales bacterium]